MVLGIVNKARIWLYENTEYVVADELLMGWAVCILKRKNDWYKVITHYGYEGYVEVTEITLTSENMLGCREKNHNLRVLCGGMVDILEEPRVQGRILYTLSRGAFVTALDENINGYQKVRLENGIKGYIPQISCMERLDSDTFLLNETLDAGYFYGQKPLVAENIFRKQVVCMATKYLGTQYRWAGKSPLGIDCSGLVFMSYMLSGILIYRDAKIMENYPIKQILPDNIKEGDLLYFPGHVAMYIGNGKYIHSTGHKESFGCVINSLKKEDAEYREDLANTLYAVGSVFD